jgi:WD40 repeat protein
VIVFLSGHGLLDTNENYYFAPYDIDFSNPRNNGVTYAELEGLLAPLPSRNKLLLLDSCHAGEIDNLPNPSTDNASSQEQLQVHENGAKGFPLKTVTSFSSASRLMEAFFTDLKTGTGTSVIAASAGNQYAFESQKWNNGVFTYALLHGLVDGSADADKDGFVNVEELRHYVATEVQRLTRGAQQPSTRADNVWNNFVVAMPDRLLNSFALSSSELSSTSFSPSSRLVMASSKSGFYRVWDTQSGALISTLAASDLQSLAAFTSENTYRVLQANSILDFNLSDSSESKHPISTGNPLLLLGYPRAFDASSGYIAAHVMGGHGDDRGIVMKGLDGATGAIVSDWQSILDFSKNEMKIYALSSDDKLVAEAYCHQQPLTSTVDLRDASSGQLRETLNLDDYVLSLAFSLDGKKLAAGVSGDRIFVWNLSDTSKPLILGSNRSLKDGISALSFSPDGEGLAAGSSVGTVQMWHLGANPTVDTLFNRDSVTAISFDSTGKMLAVGSKSGFLRIWDVSGAHF